jgi:hypothetical protein
MGNLIARRHLPAIKVATVRYLETLATLAALATLMPGRGIAASAG